MKKTFFKGIGFGVLTAILFTLMVFITISCSEDDPIIPDIPEMNIGDTYEGGIIGQLYIPGDPGYVPGEDHGLICSAEDLSAPGMSTFVWGTVGLSTLANDDDGQANTDKIIAAELTGGTTSWYAAQVCDGYSITVSGITYDDWYLPSHSELSTLIAIGMIPTQYHWSSNEIIGFSTQATVVPSPPEHLRYKDRKHAVRAIRKF